jgi:hypothetical protein
MTPYTFLEITNYAQWFGSFLIAILAFAKPKNTKKQILIIGIYGLNSVIFQSIQTGAFLIAKVHPNPTGNFYVLTETIILLWLFATAFNRKKFTSAIIVIGVLFTLFFLWSALPNLTIIHSNISTIRDIIMIIASMLYFLLSLEDTSEPNSNDMPMFWINAAVLFFFSATFTISLTNNYLVEKFEDQYGYFWGLRNLLRVTFCLIICGGIWKSYSLRQEKIR